MCKHVYWRGLGVGAMDDIISDLISILVHRKLYGSLSPWFNLVNGVREINTDGYP